MRVAPLAETSQLVEGFLPPGRNKLPTHRHDKKAGITPYDHVNRIGGADVVLRSNVARRLREPVELVKLFPWACCSEIGTP